MPISRNCQGISDSTQTKNFKNIFPHSQKFSQASEAEVLAKKLKIFHWPENFSGTKKSGNLFFKIIFRKTFPALKRSQTISHNVENIRNHPWYRPLRSSKNPIYQLPESGHAAASIVRKFQNKPHIEPRFRSDKALFDAFHPEFSAEEGVRKNA
jgi:hypothetical protein